LLQTQFGLFVREQKQIAHQEVSALGQTDQIEFVTRSDRGEGLEDPDTYYSCQESIGRKTIETEIITETWYNAGLYRYDFRTEAE
jgi:hypothetical protein